MCGIYVSTYLLMLIYESAMPVMWKTQAEKHTVYICILMYMTPTTFQECPPGHLHFHTLFTDMKRTLTIRNTHSTTVLHAAYRTTLASGRPRAIMTI